MQDLRFVGNGGATNIEFGGNSCFLKIRDNLLVIDFCEEATKRLNNLGAFDDVKNIYIAITHTHYDHLAGLGVFIWYCHYRLKLKPIILYSEESYAETLKSILKLTGVSLEIVDFMKDLDFKIDDLSLKFVPTEHTPMLQCFGFMFEDFEGKYYYTGDTRDIDFISELCKDDSVKTIYTEASPEVYDVHIKYDNLVDLDAKDKLVLMHFGTPELYERAKKDGFKVAEVDK